MILHVKMGSVLKMILAGALMHSVVQHAAHQVCVHSHTYSRLHYREYIAYNVKEPISLIAMSMSINNADCC